MTTPASPRLPSPPPIPEDQLSPVPASPEQQKLFGHLEHAAARRIRPGTKAEDMAEGPPLVELSEIESAFQLTEHLKALHNFLTHPIGAHTIPVDKSMALKLAQPPENVDKTLWLYELCRFLTQKVNAIIVALFSDSPACSSSTCPEMRASEWQYLCAVHDPPKSCCAIDYCCHTLDWAANTLTSPKHFPSRLALGTDQSTQHSQGRQLTNIFRRVYRIFAHAWFQHREMFWKVEGRTGLYILFKTVCDVYELIPEDNYTIPPEAEGIEPPTETRGAAIPPIILKREPAGPQDTEPQSTSTDAATDHSLSTSATTKRHRASPSVGATVVTKILEENEEDDEPAAAAKLPQRPATTAIPAPAQHADPVADEDDDTDAETTILDFSDDKASGNDAHTSASGTTAAQQTGGAARGADQGVAAGEEAGGDTGEKEAQEGEADGETVEKDKKDTTEPGVLPDLSFVPAGAIAMAGVDPEGGAVGGGQLAGEEEEADVEGKKKEDEAEGKGAEEEKEPEKTDAQKDDA